MLIDNIIKENVVVMQDVLAKLKFAKPQSITLLKNFKCIPQPKNIYIIYLELWKNQKIII
jgi:hypothetical protein